MAKTRDELLTELENLEIRLREIKRDRKVSMADYKDRIGDVNDTMEQVLKELDEIKAG